MVAWRWVGWWMAGPATDVRTTTRPASVRVASGDAERRATACAGALVTGRDGTGEVNSQTAILPMTFSGCRFAFDGECVKRLTRITDS
ncbi:hypothetical protein XAP3CFBP6996_013500 [Xanthomonas citri pv. fuscans CFBP 6996]|nr:hypothetical protein XAP3CFBP6996_013500 [Xanthomonas citri pv. fuscans CFBP 6996]